MIIKMIESNGSNRASNFYKDLGNYEYINDYIRGLFDRKTILNFLDIKVALKNKDGNIKYSWVMRYACTDADNVSDVLNILDSLSVSTRSISNDNMTITVNCFESEIKIILQEY